MEEKNWAIIKRDDCDLYPISVDDYVNHQARLEQKSNIFCSRGRNLEVYYHKKGICTYPPVFTHADGQYCPCKFYDNRDYLMNICHKLNDAEKIKYRAMLFTIYISILFVIYLSMY